MKSRGRGDATGLLVMTVQITGEHSHHISGADDINNAWKQTNGRENRFCMNFLTVLPYAYTTRSDDE